ncbi:MAG TPA: dienelactone hydrolase family protein, partial [Stellaceae bacterium]|nr:dienelactone hydrolase family protein [Stellaceae bacterium]
MIEKTHSIPTRAGAVDTFLCHPERNGPWPAIIFYMDAPGIREELRDMARRLASVGYYVLLPNLYYRAGAGTELGPDALKDATPQRARMWELMKSLSIELIMEDTASLLAFIDAQKEIRKDKIGVVGYCMSGPFVFTAAGRFPERFAATASIYGAGLLTDRPDSPHLLAGRIKGEIYFACAEVDKYAPLPVIDELRGVLAKAGTTHE